MRLVLVTQDFPPDTGGTQTYAFELAHRFADACDAFAVVAPAVEGSEAFDATLPFEVIRVDASYDTLSVKAAPVLTRLAQKRGFDTLFHVQWPTAIAGLWARRRSPIQRVFIAAHGRELLLSSLPSTVLRRGYDATRRRVLHAADGLFPVSHYTAGLLHDLGADAARITVAANGVDQERFTPTDASTLRERLGLSGCRIILSMCRLVGRKGVDTVLAALPKTLQHHPDVIYLIGGTGPMEADLHQQVRALSLEAHVRFLGRVPDAELVTTYNLCEVFVMVPRNAPPDVEGFGLVYLEAGACGKPVVGSTAGGIPDAIDDGQTGHLVPPDAPDALADTLISLLDHPEHSARMGATARTQILERRTWDHTAEQLLHQMQLPPT
ncbi:MAG: glycosyltransferase family 4 protein [Rhodothermales bacterium]